MTCMISFPSGLSAPRSFRLSALCCGRWRCVVHKMENLIGLELTSARSRGASAPRSEQKMELVSDFNFCNDSKAAGQTEPRWDGQTTAAKRTSESELGSRSFSTLVTAADSGVKPNSDAPTFRLCTRHPTPRTFHTPGVRPTRSQFSGSWTPPTDRCGDNEV